jgi:hypothetical protein
MLAITLAGSLTAAASAFYVGCLALACLTYLYSSDDARRERALTLLCLLLHVRPAAFRPVRAADN